MIKEGKRIYGDKFFGITKFMDETEYHQFLNSMDIAVFGMNRQQALGNILALLYFGKKIYIKENSILEHYLRMENHCEINTLHEIDRMEYAEFIQFSKECRKKNERILTHMYQLEPLVISAWNKIFNENMCY